MKKIERFEIRAADHTSGRMTVPNEHRERLDLGNITKAAEIIAEARKMRKNRDGSSWKNN